MWTCRPTGSSASSALRRTPSAVEVDAELRVVVRGLDRLVRPRLDPRGEPDEHAAGAGASGAPDLLAGIEHDERARRRGGLELLVRLVVPVEEELLAAQTGAQRELELAAGRDVGTEAFRVQQPQDRYVREGLDAEGDERFGVDRAERPRLRDDRLAAVDDERRAVLGREVGRARPADDQHTVVDGGRIGPELSV